MPCIAICKAYVCNRVIRRFLFAFFLLIPFIDLVAQQWPIIGSEQDLATATSNYTHIATALEGAEGTLIVPYVVFTESNVPKVKKYIEGAWLQVGDNVAPATATYTRIYIDDNGRIYVLYVDASNGNRLAAKTFDTTDSTWQPLNRNIANLYLSDGSVTNSISQFSTTQRSVLSFDNNNVPYVVFADGSAYNAVVKKYNGSSWETVGGMPVSDQRAVGVSMAIDSVSNQPYVVYINQATPTSTTGNLRLFKFSGTTWDSIPVPAVITTGGGSSTSGATNAIRQSNMVFNSSWNVVITYFNANNSNRTTVITFDKATQSFTYGGTLSSRDVSYNSLYRDMGGNIYSSFIDLISSGSGKSVSRVFKQRPGTSNWIELKVVDAEGIDNPTSNLSVGVGEDTSRPYVVYIKTNSSSVPTPIVRRFSSAPAPPPPPPPADAIVTTPKQMEKLNRGLIAVRTNINQVYIGWRLLGNDPANTGFNLYRDNVLLNSSPITVSTNYLDVSSVNGTYTLKTVVNGVEQNNSESISSILPQSYLSIPLIAPPAGVTPANEAYTYTANDASVGDVDGDGEYEIILKWDPTNAKDNSQSGYTGNVYLDAYKLNGTRLWRIDLGRNIRAGAHYTQFMVYDLDGDGKAEVACKTADGTIDGVGAVIGNASADYRTTAGYILSGPEFFTVFNGLTGAAMATQNYLPARGTVSSWGDTYGNRVDRFIAAVAYLDGERPSLVMGRGYYTRLVRVAWDWRNGQLTHRWTFDSNTPGNGAYAGQGNHQMSIGDVDGDGKDEIFNGSSAINDNGNGLWANAMGHGDALHMTDIDPDRPGKELWMPYEDPANNGMIGAALIDAKTGEKIFTVPLSTVADVGRAMSADIDPRYKGNEVWAARGDLYSAKGVVISTSKPSMNFGIWWDADSTRELLDGTTISKWNYLTNNSSAIMSATGTSSNNSTKSTPALSADIFGDWREELILRTSDNSSLRIYTTTAVASSRIYTLMHDPQYRTAIAWQNGAYNQPPHPGFYIGPGMASPPVPNIYFANDQQVLPVTLVNFNANKNGKVVDLQWQTASEINNKSFTVQRSKDGVSFNSIQAIQGAGTSRNVNNYTTVDNAPINGINYYRLMQTNYDGKETFFAIRLVDMQSTSDFSIAPNPVTNKVNLMLKTSSTNLKLIVTTVDGNVIIRLGGSLSQLNDQLNLRLSKLIPGTYVLHLVDGPRKFVSKMIKQ